MSENFYITTPIYYPSGKWHLGTCYTTVVCDAIARFKRLQGFNVFYQTGTDEHGMKIEKIAKSQNMTPENYLKEPVNNLKNLWKILNISYDKFIRTTDKEHEKAVQKIFQKLYDKGDIYKGEYEGMYCVPCETYWTKTQLKDGKCPDCGREVTHIKEEGYFFRLSKYTDKLIKLIRDTDFLEPKTRRNEMLNNFLLPGLQDLSVTRSNFDWGIKVPFDEKYTIYVWIDALTNYITSLGYLSDDDKLMKTFWPCDIHMMGKEIVRFHSIIWPAMLMALDLPVPKKVYGHGWLLMGGDKMSKSKSNVVDPFILTKRYSTDAVRYYLLREIPFGQDGMFTSEAFLKKINSDLANDLGNLVSRTLAMLEQNFEGKTVGVSEKDDEFSADLKKCCNNLYNEVKSDMDNLMVSDSLGKVWKVIARANKYIDETRPWVLAKEGDKQKLSDVLGNLLEAIRMVAVILQAYLPDTAEKILDAIKTDKKYRTFESLKFTTSKGGKQTEKIPPIFPRLDVQKELKELEKVAEENEKQKKSEHSENKDGENTVKTEEISIDDFAKVSLKVALVTECSKVENADKLLKLTLKVGEESRTVVSGIAKWYTPEEMIGKSVVIVSNLKPCKLRGILSQGMILCADDGKGGLSIISPEKKIESGSTVR